LHSRADPEDVAQKNNYRMLMFAAVVNTGPLHLLNADQRATLGVDSAYEGFHALALEILKSHQRIALFVEPDNGWIQHDFYRKRAQGLLDSYIAKDQARENLPDMSHLLA
jgi:hypothetical protein